MTTTATRNVGARAAWTEPAVERSPRVSVIVPVYNGGQDFVRCLAALRSSTEIPADSWELIVADDGSTDGSVQKARAVGGRVAPSPGARSGPAAARNAGAAVARGEVLLFVDADVLVRCDTLARMLAAFDASPTVAAIFGSYDEHPAASNFLSQYKNLFHHYVHQTSRSEATTFWAGCGAVRAAIFRELGGFDPRYDRPCIEDIELGYRLTRAGYAVRLCHDLQVTHLKRWTAVSMVKSDILDRGIPWTELLLRERAFTADLNLQTSNRISVVCVYLLAMATAGALLQPLLALAVLPLLVALMAFNAPLYRFFLRQRGVRFTLAAAPWHWFYYAYNGVSFVIGTLVYLYHGRPTAAAVPAHATERGGGDDLSSAALVTPLRGD